MADGKKSRPLSFSSKKTSWSPEKLPSPKDGCLQSLAYKKKCEPLLTDVNKPEADKGNRPKEKDDMPSEEYEKKETPESDSPDNPDQEMAFGLQISSSSSSTDEGICEPCTEVNKPEAEKGHEQKESDEDDVFMPGEKPDRKQRSGSCNPDTPTINRNRPVTIPKHFSTMKPKRSSLGGETGGPKDSLSQTESISDLKGWRQLASKKIERKCGTEVNTAEADKGNEQNETGVEGDQPDARQPDPAPQKSTPVSEVVDQASVDLAHELTFRDLSEKIGKEWEKLATYLGVAEKKLEHIKMNHPDVEKRIYYMLMKWKSLTKNFGSSSFRSLADQLELVGQRHLAEKLRRQFKFTDRVLLLQKSERSFEDVIDKSVDEDSRLSAAGDTITTQTTQAVTQMTPRFNEQTVKETPSHLQEVLNEFNKQTEDINDIKKTDIFLQLPYMAIGYFDNKGGILALKKYDVHLYIPHGAIAEGPPQLVYIYINPDAVVADTVNGVEEQLSPKVHCGSPGLTFEKSVVLSFPHHAESSDWEFTAKMSSASSPAWQALNSSTDGQLVSAKGNNAIFLVNHFTVFALFGISFGTRRKRVRVGAFGDIFCPCSYAFRVYVWKDDRVSEERVVEFEKKNRSKTLDAFRDLKFLKGKGHMRVEMTETIEGWHVRPQTTQEIHEKDVWSLLQNSVSFNVKTSGPSNTDDSPYMAVNCYQQLEGRRILLSVGPTQTQMRNNNLCGTCKAQRHVCGAPRLMPTSATCQTDESGDNTLQLSVTEVRRVLSNAIVDRRPCSEPVRMYGGLSDQKVNELCESLDNQAADDLGLHLLDYLSGNEYIPPSTAKKDVLAMYFSKCSKLNIPDQEAVQYLTLVFHKLKYTRAAEIIEPDGQRADARAEPILQFLDNESLMKVDAEICFQGIAEKLGDEWERLATYLGISHSEVCVVKRDNACSVSNQIFCMLVRWQQGLGPFGEEAFVTLSSNLKRIERNDLVELLKGKITSMLFFERQNNIIQ